MPKKSKNQVGRFATNAAPHQNLIGTPLSGAQHGRLSSEGSGAKPRKKFAKRISTWQARLPVLRSTPSARLPARQGTRLNKPSEASRAKEEISSCGAAKPGGGNRQSEKSSFWCNRNFETEISRGGYTLIELMVSFTIFALLALSAFYLFETETERTRIETESDKIVYSLKIAQQNAIAAYRGYDYSIQFDKPNNRYTLQPEGEAVTLDPKIKIESVDPPTITFQKLTGNPKNGDFLEITLVSKRFRSTIQVDSEGIITATNPERI